MKKRLTMLNQNERENFEREFEYLIFLYFKKTGDFFYKEEHLDEEMFQFVFETMKKLSKFDGYDILKEEIPFIVKECIDDMLNKGIDKNSDVYLEIETIRQKLDYEEQLPENYLDFYLTAIQLREIFKQPKKDRSKSYGFSMKESIGEEFKDLCREVRINASKLVEKLISDYLENEGKEVLEKHRKQFGKK